MKLEPCVIFASGIGMVGKSFTMRELCKLVDNAFHMTMDVINPANLHIPTVSFSRLPKFEDYVAKAGIFPHHAKKVQTPCGEMWKIDPTDDRGVSSEFYGRHVRDQCYLIQLGIAEHNIELGKVPIIEAIVYRQIRDGTLQRFKDFKGFKDYPKYHFHFLADEKICYQRYLERLDKVGHYDSKRYPMNKKLSREEFHHFMTEEQPIIPKELEKYEHLKIDTTKESPRECAERCLNYIMKR